MLLVTKLNADFHADGGPTSSVEFFRCVSLPLNASRKEIMVVGSSIEHALLL